jgi:hypothetical protein
MDLNHRPHPYQFWPERRLVGQGSVIPGVVVGYGGSACGGVAVTVAVSAPMSQPSAPPPIEAVRNGAQSMLVRQNMGVHPSDWIATGIAVASLVVSAAAFLRTGHWRTQERRAAEPRLEVVARPWYTAGGESGIVLARVEVIAQNVSTADIAITELGIEPVDSTGPLRVFGGRHNSFPKTVKAGTPFYYTIAAQAFEELLEGFSKRADEMTFSVYVRSGHGSVGRIWNSSPFSVAPSDPPSTSGGGMYSEWAG